MATLTIQSIVEAGLTANYTSAAGGGDVVPNDGTIFLHVKNGGGTSVTVTVTAQTTTTTDPSLGAVTKSNVAKAIAAGAEAFIGPLKKQAFNNSQGQIAITYSGVTSLTIAALRTQ